MVLHDGEKNWRYVYSFWQNARTWRTHTPHDSIGRACIASRCKNRRATDHYTSIRWLVHCRWWVGCYIWYSEEGTGRATAPPSPLLTVQNVTTVHPSTASVQVSTWHYVPVPIKRLKSPYDGHGRGLLCCTIRVVVVVVAQTSVRTELGECCCLCRCCCWAQAYICVLHQSPSCSLQLFRMLARPDGLLATQQ